jgi:hypothetical protein
MKTITGMMMKTIEQAAMECAGNAPCGIPNFKGDDYNAGYISGLTYGFEEGVAFALRWTSAEEAFPPENTPVLGKYARWYMVVFWMPKHGKWFISGTGDEAGAPEHWRPVEFEL